MYICKVSKGILSYIIVYKAKLYKSMKEIIIIIISYSTNLINKICLH